ncbi:phage tail sheath subtilisin-like domain-containing protein [Chitinimonas sp.]|uniref:phage tail sheath subtilisin-like domain-containing protein n=1 Tax=Chitinimonas sp. TaxID=1934313 RepID=UPI002F92D28B
MSVMPETITEAMPAWPHPIHGVDTSITAFIGRARSGPAGEVVAVASLMEFERIFGGLWLASTLGYAVRDFFLNGGSQARILRLQAEGNGPLTGHDFLGPEKEAKRQGLYALDQLEHFNLLCIPPHTAGGSIEPALIDAASAYCAERGAILLVDPPANWTSTEAALHGLAYEAGQPSGNAALYYPRLSAPNPLRRGQQELFAPCGAIAGILARLDAQHGVWKAPAGLDASLQGSAQAGVSMDEHGQATLNSAGINCLRALPQHGTVVWGARTRSSGDIHPARYLPVRRTQLYIEQSLQRGTRWAVFEPNSEALWAQLRASVEDFLQGLFRRGAFLGASPEQAYYVRCDRSTMNEADIAQGLVRLQLGFAPLKPAEFVTLQLNLQLQAT